MKVGFISLGCSKNLVDTEMMIGLFKNHHYEIVNNPKEAEVIVINTCGFIKSAKEEAINTMLEMANYKNSKEGKCKILIATGCLVERYKEDLEKLIPEVDIYLKFSEYAESSKKSAEVFEKVFSKIEEKNIKNKENLTFLNRVITTGKNYAYIRIAEGCDNRCTYCAIPNIRGKFISRKIEDILEEAKSLAKQGFTEIILIAQDTSKYGIDIYKKPMLAELLGKLAKIKELKWIRFLYTYPETITEDLIKVVKENDNICKYFDIPIQHISNNILKRMNRRVKAEDIKDTIKNLRENIPNVTIRTTVMVGFPGETKEDFEELYNFIKQTKFDKLGAFTYSKEEGTPAYTFKNQVHPQTKKARYNKIMKLQQEISIKKEREQIGKVVEVLVESITKNKKYYVGRTSKDVPDIDGLAYIVNDNKIDLIGQYIKCKITDVRDYDVICKKI